MDSLISRDEQHFVKSTIFLQDFRLVFKPTKPQIIVNMEFLINEIFRVLFPDQNVLSFGAIFGIVAGVLLAVGIGVVVAICFCSKKKVHGKCSTETAVVEVVVE